MRTRWWSRSTRRPAAHMAEIPALKEAFRRGDDIHAMTASQVFGVPVEGMDPMVRRRAKAINFGIVYGIRDYMDKTKKIARERGYVTTPFGRRCHLPGILNKNPARRSFMERAAINAPLQGTAADIIKRAMIRVPPALTKAKLRARMLLQVHDELLFEVPEAELDATAAVVKKVMEGAALPAYDLSVPL